jgi:hypothetical protein
MIKSSRCRYKVKFGWAHAMIWVADLQYLSNYFGSGFVMKVVSDFTVELLVVFS